MDNYEISIKQFLKEDELFNKIFEKYIFILKEKNDFIKDLPFNDFSLFFEYLISKRFYYFENKKDVKESIFQFSKQVIKALNYGIKNNVELKKFISFNKLYLSKNNYQEGFDLFEKYQPNFISCNAIKDKTIYLLIIYTYKFFLKNIFSLKDEELILLMKKENYLYNFFKEFQTKETSKKERLIDLEVIKNLDYIEIINDIRIFKFYINKKVNNNLIPNVALYLKNCLINHLSNKSNCKFNNDLELKEIIKSIIKNYKNLDELDYEYIREILLLLDNKNIDNLECFLKELEIFNYKLYKDKCINHDLIFDLLSLNKLNDKEIKLIFDLEKKIKSIDYGLFINRVKRAIEISLQNNLSIKFIVNLNKNSYYKNPENYKLYSLLIILFSNFNNFY